MAAFLKKLACNPANVLRAVPAVIRGVAKRHGSDARKVHITPTRYNYTSFKNDFHFYTMLGVVPLGSIIFYSNYIIGQSELAEIPEGYEPKTWEYYKHPISRWFARYIYRSPAKSYELYACKIVTEFEEMRERRFIKKARELMRRDDDYRAYYFVPAVDPRPVENMQQLNKERPDFMGTG